MKTRRNNRQTCKWMIFATCLFVLFSCTYGEPDEDWTRYGRIRLSLDWQGASHPSVMNYYFYKDGTDLPVIRQGNADGYQGTLPSGTYRVAVCNTNSRNVLLKMDKGFEKAYGRAEQVTILKSSPSNVTGPDNLYGGGCEAVVVEGKEPAEKQLYPAGLVRTLELHIKITGSKKGEIALAGLTGYLTGVSTDVYIPTGAAFFDAPAFMAFDAERVGAASYRTLLTLFGLSDGINDTASGNGSTDKVAAIYLTLKGADGKELTTSVTIPDEVGEMFRKKTSSRVVLDLIVAYDEANGLSTSLEDWKEGTGDSGVSDDVIG